MLHDDNSASNNATGKKRLFFLHMVGNPPAVSTIKLENNPLLAVHNRPTHRSPPKPVAGKRLIISDAIKRAATLNYSAT